MKATATGPKRKSREAVTVRMSFMGVSPSGGYYFGGGGRKL